MWPKRVENPTHLLNIFGHYPNLDDIEETVAALESRIPMLTLSFISKVLPYRPPGKWRAFNRVFYQLQFSPITSVDLSKFTFSGSSSLRMRDHASEIHVECSGAVDLTLRCNFLRIDKITGLLVEDDD